MSLDHGLPFLDHGAQFVAGQVHAMEVGQNITSLDFLSHEFELPEGHFIILKVSQGDLKHTPLQTVRCNSCKSKLRMTYPIGDTRVVIGEIYYVKLVTIKLKFQNTLLTSVVWLYLGTLWNLYCSILINCAILFNLIVYFILAFLEIKHNKEFVYITSVKYYDTYYQNMPNPNRYTSVMGKGCTLINEWVAA